MPTTLDDVRQRVHQDDEGKHDNLVPVSNLTLHHGRLFFPGADDDGFGFALSPWATAQACAKLGIPTAYFNRCPADLQDQQFNHWTREEEAIRKVAQAGGSDGGNTGSDPLRWLLRARHSTVRGILSPRYEKLDNRQLMEVLIPALNGSRYDVQLVEIAAESFHLRLTDPRLCRLALPGDPLFVAIHVANSEVGLRAVTIDACVYRLVCTNGLVRRVAGKSLLRQRHIHVASERFVPALQEAIGQASLLAAAFIEQMILSTKTAVPDPEKAIHVLADAWKLSQQTVEYIRFGLLGESDQDSLYGLLNAVTNAAQRLPMESRFELETLASVLIDTTDTSREGQALRQRVLAPKTAVLA